MKKHLQTRSDGIWRVVIVDDEPRSRAIARRMLSAYPNFKIVAECANGYDALAAVSEFMPHLMLLDIQMPALAGFAMFKNITPAQLSIFAFLTPFDQHAVRAS